MSDVTKCIRFIELKRCNVNNEKGVFVFNDIFFFRHCKGANRITAAQQNAGYNKFFQC